MAKRVRSAKPHDSGFLGWAVLASSRSHLERGPFDAMVEVEDDLLDVMEWLTVSEEPSNCHFEHFLVAEHNGAAVAALAGFDPAWPGMTRLSGALADAFEGLHLGDDALARALASMEPYRTCAPELVPGTWTIEWVATRAGVRRTGLCTRLLDAALEKGRSGGYANAQISLMLGNEPARSAYLKAGFEVAGERRHPDFERAYGSPGMLRMLRKL